MEDIFQDQVFDKFLYGGVRDLEKPVGQLVYNLYKKGIITTWSCSGHIARFNEDAGGRALEGHQVYLAGRLHYKDSPESLSLTEELRRITRIHAFAELIKRDGMNFNLEMQDLVVPCSIKEYAEKQVPLALAQARYGQFLKIWDELTSWSKLNL